MFKCLYQRKSYQSRYLRKKGEVRRLSLENRVKAEDSTASPINKNLKSRVKNFLPVLQWLPFYDRSNLKNDIVAGITVGAVTVPEAMAYASLAGLPVEIGLYAALVVPLLYLLFASCRQMSVGPASALSAMIAAPIAVLSGGDPSRAVALASFLAIMVGTILVVFYIIRLGIISYFISNTVLVGFKAGAALFIISSQLSKLFGIPGGGENFFEKVANIILNLDQTNWISLAFGVSGLAFLFIGKRYFHRLPNKLILVIAATAAAVLAAYLGINLGVDKAGFIPQGLPPFVIPSVTGDDVLALLPLALGVVLLTIVEGVAIGKTFAKKHGYPLNTDKEILGWGAGNIVTGFLSGYPTDASFSRSAMADESGAKTPLFNLFAVLVIGLVLVLFATFFSNMPEPIIGAVIIFAVLGLIEIPAFKSIYAFDRKEFLVAIIAFLGVLFFGLLEGVLIGVLLTLLLFAYKASRISVSVLGRIIGTAEYADIERTQTCEALPGIMIFRANGPILFTNAERLGEYIINKVKDQVTPVRLVILSLSTSLILDKSMIDLLKELQERLNQKGIDFRLAEVIGNNRDTLEKSGLVKELHVMGPAMTIDSVIKDWEQRAV
jgi:high affinity sulfate transporter 1